jgi:hypothetical protein
MFEPEPKKAGPSHIIIMMIEIILAMMMLIPIMFLLVITQG